MVREFRRRGLVAYGVEPAGWNPEEGIVDTLDHLPPGMRFDIIILQDVLEHLFDAVQMLRDLHRYAAKGAHLFCSVPASDSWPARRYKARWSMILPFGHLQYFSKRSAREALRLGGWQMRNATRASTTPLPNLLAELRFREIIYSLLKGGRDQLYVCAVERDSESAHRAQQMPTQGGS
jgi:SAM-dependent methyltransferase